MSERCPHCGKNVPVTAQEKVLQLLQDNPSAMKMAEIVDSFPEYTNAHTRKIVDKLNKKGLVCHVQRGWWSA